MHSESVERLCQLTLSPTPDLLATLDGAYMQEAESFLKRESDPKRNVSLHVIDGTGVSGSDNNTDANTTASN